MLRAQDLSVVQSAGLKVAGRMPAQASQAFCSSARAWGASNAPSNVMHDALRAQVIHLQEGCGPCAPGTCRLGEWGHYQSHPPWGR